MFWWKKIEEYSTDEVLSLLLYPHHDYHFYMHYYNEVLDNNQTKFLNSIIKLDDYSATLILTDVEYNWLIK